VKRASSRRVVRPSGVQVENLARVGGLIPDEPSFAPAIRWEPAVAGSLR